MPQINRIRVNNVKYNFGTQYYDDFMMSFSGKNTIYDLANGGGKSVLLLLLLQNLIPNCTLDEKQPVEKLFRTQGGSSVIHSLVEWKLDSCYQKDGYQYMTTGFCARKAKEQVGERDAENAGIEYFNYVIFYKRFGDNDIRNLPLSANGERITYNGLKSYLRGLDKNDLSVEAYIFERKGDYQNFIAGYGLFESHWEIIRGINKTEGHVRTYFETNYRTARKVIEDLLIEEIIQKSYYSRIGDSNREDDMARTLIDIKDKLTELAKKKEQISCYDRQIVAMNAFSQKIQDFSDVMMEKAALMGQMSDYLIKCRRLIVDTEKLLASNETSKMQISEKLLLEKRAIATAKIMEEQKNLEELNQAAKECQNRLEEMYAKLKEQQEKLARAEAAEDYQEYKEQKGKRDEVLVTIENSLRGESEVTEELYALASAKKGFYDAKMSALAKERENANDTYQKILKEDESLQEKKREFDITAAVFDSNIYTYEKREEEARKQLATLMAECELMVENELAERVKFEEENLEAIEEKENLDTKKLEAVKARLDEVREKEIQAKASSQILTENIAEEEKHLARCQEIAERLTTLAGIYKESEPQLLVKAAYQVYSNQLKITTDMAQEIRELRAHIENLKEGRLVFDGTQYKAVETYLNTAYEGRVLRGNDWYNSLPSHIKRDVIKRIPFVEYSFVIKDDFEPVLKDAKLRSFLNCSYAVPIISENILYSTKLGVDLENIVFGMQDFNFLKEEGKLAEVISRAQEELENLEDRHKKSEDRLEIIREDYAYISEHAVSNREDITNITARKNELAQEVTSYKEILAHCENTYTELISEEHRLKEDLKAAKENGRQVLLRIEALKRALDKKVEADKLAEDIVALKKESVKAHADKKELDLNCQKSCVDRENARLECNRIEAAYLKVQNDWNENYSAYYKAEIPSDKNAYSEEELDARFMGLRGVVENASADVNDKRLLAKSYENAMEKCRKAIEYRGFLFEEIAGAFEEGSLNAVGRENLLEMKQLLAKSNGECEEFSKEYSARSAQINRIEGSISHGIAQLEENYGAYEIFDCADIREFIRSHEAGLKEIQNTIKELEKSIATMTATLNNYRIMERDILRITKDAGIEMPEEIVYDGIVSEEDIKDYERVEKQFKVLNKNEYRKREEFLKERQKLCDTLSALGASDLAEEAAKSLNAPQDVEEVTRMRQNIEEINRCIELERDSVTAGIADMERIKDSFENRCIQTCVNIRAELDRLPQLSKITMDDEVISIIGLVIPYVKEEFYKERMSAYVNDTIEFAETFKNMDEKVKYIRTRLSWKKMFSVIVTDMNQVRINLYKRERIRSQSRYLRYEEAVGSTGQSQGIYIQFLIAVINYIASINAAGREASVMGKTIFIDNPFGAAKDVYIWEPIFKMLKTNHVQLVVPARGATPAITGRFDVNYILGQKMVGDMQQTVVVDYASNVQGEEMEYARLSYEQATLFDLDES